MLFLGVFSHYVTHNPHSSYTIKHTINISIFFYIFNDKKYGITSISVLIILLRRYLNIIMKIVIISKNSLFSQSINYYLNNRMISQHTLCLYPEMIDSIPQGYDFVIVNGSDFTGDIRKQLDFLEICVSYINSHIILINSRDCLFENKGYSVFPEGGSLENLSLFLKNPHERSMQKEDTQQQKIIDLSTRALTRRQREVLHRLLDSKSYDDISKELGISINTTKKHISSLYTRYSVTSKASLIRLFFLTTRNHDNTGSYPQKKGEESEHLNHRICY